MDDAVRHGHLSVQTILRENGAHLTEVEMGVKMCTAAAEADVAGLQVCMYVYVYVCVCVFVCFMLSGIVCIHAYACK